MKQKEKSWYKVTRKKQIALNHRENHLAAIENDESKEGLSSTIATKKNRPNTKKETKLR